MNIYLKGIISLFSLITLYILPSTLIFATTIYSPSLEEKITEYNSKIEILSNNKIKVTENISVNVKNDQIKHGIYRDFPTTYQGYLTIFKSKRSFNLEQVLLNNKSIQYRTEDINGGVRVYIGDPEVYVPQGIHKYTIIYTTDRQIVFNPNKGGFDQLNYNITGNGWSFFIDKATADIYFPKPLKTDQIKVNGFTGLTGSKEQNYSSQLRDDGRGGSFVHIETTRRLNPYEGLSVEVAFPTQIIESPTISETIIWLLTDNLLAILSIILTVIVFCLYLYFWKKHGDDKEIPNVIIPEYDAPHNLSAGAIRYINQRGHFDNKVITSLIVSLAIKKYLLIENRNKDHYEIKLLKEYSDVSSDGILSNEEKSLITGLFREKNLSHTDDTESNSNIHRIKVISSTYDPEITKMIQKVEKLLKKSIDNIYYKKNRKYLVIPILLSFFAVISLLKWQSDRQLGVASSYILGSIIPISIFVIVLFNYIKSFKSSRLIENLVRIIPISFFLFIICVLFLSILPSIVVNIPSVTSSLAYDALIIFIPIILLAINIVFAHLIQTRTVLGTEIQHKIEGLKLFISTVEDQRYKSEINKTIPHTLEVYEKYLPYAIALDIEPVWTKKFKDVIDKANIEMTSGANSISNGFIYGSGFTNSSFASSFTSTINSSSTAPSSSGSGFSGGSSGGGGGGGGGGGW